MDYMPFIVCWVVCRLAIHESLYSGADPHLHLKELEILRNIMCYLNYDKIYTDTLLLLRSRYYNHFSTFTHIYWCCLSMCLFTSNSSYEHTYNRLTPKPVIPYPDLVLSSLENRFQELLLY